MKDFHELPSQLQTDLCHGPLQPPQRNLEVEEMIRNYALEVNCKYYHDGCQVELSINVREVSQYPEFP